jgi:hypothetical protein
MKMKKLYIILLIIFVLPIIYWTFNMLPSQNWKEYRSLVRIWPRLQKEKIESICFCNTSEDESFFQQLVTTFSFRVRDAKTVESWGSGIEVPKENLPECIKIIDRVMKGKNPSWMRGGWDVWLGRMLIVTNKGKYIVHVETDISKEAGSKVYGEEWNSCELGKFIAKYCFPDIEYKYSFPLKEQVVAILLYPPNRSSPLAIFGDKKLAEEILFKTEFPDDPNGLQGIGNLYKLTRLCKFGVKTSTTKDGKIIADNKLEPKMLFEGHGWLEKIMDAYETAIKETEEKEKYYPGLDSIDARIVFMTRDGDYWKEIGIDKNTVYDDYIKSEQLKAYFDELGLTKELSAAKPR